MILFFFPWRLCWLLSSAHSITVLSVRSCKHLHCVNRIIIMSQRLAFKRNMRGPIITRHVNAIDLTSSRPCPLLPPAIDLCICAFLHYTFSASHPTSSQNKVRVYWLNVRGVKITEQRLKAGCCWLSLPGWQRAAFTHTLGLWSPGSILPPFAGLGANVSHLAQL